MAVFRMFCFASFMLLAACSSPGKPRVVERGPTPPYHVVAAGETLYSIALRYDVDYRELAAINRLSSDYRIYPQQKLLLKASPAAVTASRPVPKPVATKPTPVATPAKPPAAPAVALPKPPPVGKEAPVTPPVAATFTWGWPVDGSVIARFSASGVGNKGLDFAGKRGDAVRAAADGTVVYAGAGLVGYGNLIIVRHNNNYISAYAHNDRFRVKEGDNVKLGQIIAEMGSSGADRDKLHFEIRREGKPVDPLQYLPPR